jgi:hypothetical protein
MWGARRDEAVEPGRDALPGADPEVCPEAWLTHELRRRTTAQAVIGRVDRDQARSTSHQLSGGYRGWTDFCRRDVGPAPTTGVSRVSVPWLRRGQQACTPRDNEPVLSRARLPA